ncbi:hypothetical protein [Bartonella grahamii]|uniref:hypothetical protein n=1 Tax=Bartonella grahamii TaxID=33045 RepID=UPI002E7B7940|nr:hypothetical protein [Bartonella grahamii]
MWICKSEVEVQGRGDLCCVCFCLVWNVFRELGGGYFKRAGLVGGCEALSGGGGLKGWGARLL